VPTAVQQELNEAQSYYEQALAALKDGDLGTYQSDINSMDSEIQAAQNALKAATGTSTTTATTTTTTTPAKSKSPSHATKSKSPTTTEPRDSTTTTTLASASAALHQ
jgi:peptidoglycan hydrolase CwlO-like protein